MHGLYLHHAQVNIFPVLPVLPIEVKVCRDLDHHFEKIVLWQGNLLGGERCRQTRLALVARDLETDHHTTPCTPPLFVWVITYGSCCVKPFPYQPCEGEPFDRAK